MAVSTRRRPMTNVDADLDAASAPLTIDPVAGEPRLHRSHAERMQALIASGMSPKQAMQVAGRQVVEAETAAGQARADARVQSGYRDPRQTAYNADTFAEGYGFDDSGNPAFLGPVDIDNPRTGGLPGRSDAPRLIDREYNFRDPRGAEVALNDLPHPGREVRDDPPRRLGVTVGGPRTLDGRPPEPPRSLMTPEDVEAYDVRPPRGLSERDRDMRERGMVPVVTPNGVTYMLEYRPTEAPTEEDIISGGRGAVVAGRDGKLFRPPNDGYPIPGGPGRAGPRPDLEGKYETKVMVGPDGNPVQVLVPDKDMREKEATALAGRQAAYQTRKVAREEDFQSRRAHRLALAQLAGGSQNINSDNRWMAEALLAMTPEQRSSSMRYMLPGGNLAAGVDAQNAQLSGKMAQQAMTAFLANNPGADPEARKRAEDLMLREKNPPMAGAQDIAGGNASSTEAMKEFARLAESLDTTPGGFSYDNERALAETLRKPPYNMPQAEAEAKAYEYAEKRRWVTGGGPGGVRPPTPEGLEDVHPSGAM